MCRPVEDEDDRDARAPPELPSSRRGRCRPRPDRIINVNAVPPKLEDDKEECCRRRRTGTAEVVVGDTGKEWTRTPGRWHSSPRKAIAAIQEAMETVTRNGTRSLFIII